MALKRATKELSKLRLAIYGLSGGGKTFSSLAIAEGIVKVFGGKIALLDTEFRTANKYASIFNFETDDFGEPSIDNYIKFIDMVKEDPDVTVLVIDSLTHAWQYILEMVDKLKETTCRGDSRKAWSMMTPEYKKLVNAILRAPFHIIGTMRAKTEWSTTNENGNKTVRRDTLAPEQRDGFEYEFDMLIELNANHYGTVIKDRTGKFQDEIIQKPGFDFGRKLAEWLKDGAVPTEMQIQNILAEIGNIIKSKSDINQTPYFTDEEYNKIKKDCIDSSNKSQDARLGILQNILDEQKKILHERVEKEESAPAKAPVTAPIDTKSAAKATEKPTSLKENLDKIAREKAASKTVPNTATSTSTAITEPKHETSNSAETASEVETETSETTSEDFQDDIPGENPDLVSVTPAGQLDIF
jgi:hypothetical protein